MTDTQLYLAVGVPVIAILASMLLNMLAILGIREELKSICADINRIDRRLELIEAEFHKVQSKQVPISPG